MSAPIDDLAEAITGKLNTVGAFTPALNAEQTRQLYYELPAAKTPKITVIGTADQSVEKVDRSRWKHELTVDVPVQQKLETDQEAEKKAVVALADSICEFIKANRPVGPWALMEATVNPLLQNERLQQNKLFTSVIRFTFTQHR
jgi:hypothetical protein